MRRKSQRIMTPLVGAKLLDAVGECRYKLTRVQAEMPVQSVEYRTVTGIVAQIDALAEVLTGDRAYFHLKSHPTPHV